MPLMKGRNIMRMRARLIVLMAVWRRCPTRRFEVLFRLYGPKKELFEKTWKLPDIVEAGT